MTLWFYPIDWETTGMWMQAYAGFAGAGAVVYAAMRGGNSFDSWLRQRIRERRIAVGERILTAAYKAKDAFPSIRSPGQFGYEVMAARKKLEEEYDNFNLETEGKRGRLETAQVVLSRISSHADIWRELYECLPLSRALFGASVEDEIRKLLGARHKLSVSAQMYPETDPHANRDFYERIQSDVWEGWADTFERPDEINNVVAGAVARIEELVLPTLSEAGATTKPRMALLARWVGK
jgi:hypothetical protein